MIFEEVFVVGDTHNDVDYDKLKKKNFPESKESTKKTLVVQLGDFGFFWHQPNTKGYKSDINLLNWLSLQSYTFAFLDGNHENFDLINKLPEEDFCGGKVGVWTAKNGVKIYHLKRGEIYIFNGKKFLVIGSAESQDKNEVQERIYGVQRKRPYRTEGLNWWKEEELSEQDKENVIKNLDKHNWEVFGVLTHTCPVRVGMDISVCESGGAYNYSQDKFNRCFKRGNDSTATFLEELMKKGLKTTIWHFGHWHLKDYRYTDQETGTKFFCHYNGRPFKIDFPTVD